MTALILLSKFRETEIEIWRPITHVAILPDAYDVSSLGRVRSYLRAPKGNQYSGKIRTRSSVPRLLAINTSKDKTVYRDGYGQVCLQTLTGERMFRVHLLVAAAFLSNPDNYTQVNHKTAVKSDNRLPNLEWATHDSNHEHAPVNGLRQSGEKHWAARLTEAVVRSIREDYMAGIRQIDIARKFSLRRHTVWQIVHRKIWRSVE